MINEFRGKYYFLSNFYSCKVEWEGLTYENNEAAFQSAKCIKLEQRKNFLGLDPSSAKRKGRRVKLRDDWEEVKDQIMYEIVLNKFSQNEELRKKLIATGDEYLEEGNTWHDTYWGVCNGKGKKIDKVIKNKTWEQEVKEESKILMQVREELKLDK